MLIGSRLPSYFLIFTSPVCAILPLARAEVGISKVKTFGEPFLHILPILPGSCGSYHIPSYKFKILANIETQDILGYYHTPRGFSLTLQRLATD